MPANVFRHQHRVTYAECTAGNHIYYSRYLDLLEAARGEFFREIGQPFLRWQEAGLLLPVIECQLRYKNAARYDDLLSIEVWLTNLERVRLTFAYRISTDRVIVEAVTTHACTTLQDKPQRIPTELTAALSPYLHE